jgi:serine/threonine protein kinase
LPRPFALLVLAAVLSSSPARAAGFWDSCARFLSNVVGWSRPAPVIPPASPPPPLAEAVPWKLPPVSRIWLDHRLGAGAAGEVFRARLEFEDGRPMENVVAKRLKGVPNHRAEPLLEAELDGLARVQRHRAAVVVVDGVPYLVQRPFSDRTLRAVLDGPAEGRQAIAARVLDSALTRIDEIHRAGLTHNDIKPENLLVNEKGEVLPIDFFLARRIGDPEAQMEGTIAYMSPLRWLDETPAPAHDLFGLGLSMLELELPSLFRAGSPYAIERALPGGGRFDAVGRVPDDTAGIAPERAMAHVTLVKRSVDDYRKLLFASKSRETFVREYVAQWLALQRTAETTKNTELEDVLFYELFTAPKLGPELWKAIPDAGVRSRALARAVKHRKDLAANKSGLAILSWHKSMGPMLEEFFSHPDVRGARELRR